MPALNIIRTGDFRPATLLYGSAQISVLTLVYIIYFLYGVRRGYFATVADVPVFLDYRAIDRYPFPGVFISGRILTAVLGSLTILTTYYLGKRLAGRRAGLIAAVLLATLPAHILNSHFITTDVPMLVVVILAITQALDVLERASWRDYLGAGFFVGLAASTRYLGGIAVGALLVAHMLRVRSWSELFEPKLAAGLAAVAVGFLIGTPFALDLPYFLNWLAHQIHVYGGSLNDQAAMVEGPASLYYLKQIFLSPCGLIAILGTWGLVWLFQI